VTGFADACAGLERIWLDLRSAHPMVVPVPAFAGLPDRLKDSLTFAGASGLGPALSAGIGLVVTAIAAAATAIAGIEREKDVKELLHSTSLHELKPIEGRMIGAYGYERAIDLDERPVARGRHLHARRRWGGPFAHPTRPCHTFVATTPPAARRSIRLTSRRPRHRSSISWGRRSTGARPPSCSRRISASGSSPPLRSSGPRRRDRDAERLAPPAVVPARPALSTARRQCLELLHRGTPAPRPPGEMG